MLSLKDGGDDRRGPKIHISGLLIYLGLSARLLVLLPMVPNQPLPMGTSSAMPQIYDELAVVVAFNFYERHEGSMMRASNFRHI